MSDPLRFVKTTRTPAGYFVHVNSYYKCRFCGAEMSRGYIIEGGVFFGPPPPKPTHVCLLLTPTNNDR